MADPILQPVVNILHEKGATEDEIADTLGSLIQAATIMLYQQAMDTFSDEEMQQIDQAPDDTAANHLITTFYAQKMDSSPEEITQKFLKEFVKKFVEEHEA